MKYTFLILLITILLSCSEKNNTLPTQPDNTVDVDSIERRLYEQHIDSPWIAISLLKELIPIYQVNNEVKKTGFAYLNIASIFDEQLNEADSAVNYLNQSLEVWQKSNDSMEIANILKYKGWLEAKTGNQEEGINSIEKALLFYSDLNFVQGIAVSKINLARIKLAAGQLSDSESLFLQSKEVWSNIGDLSRIFTDNTLGIEIYQQMGNSIKEEFLIRENQSIMDQIQLNDQNVKNFELLIND